MDAVEVPKRKAAALIRELFSRDFVDRSRRITRRGDSVLIPVRTVPRIDLTVYSARTREAGGLEPRIRRGDPRSRLRTEFAAMGIPLDAVPTKWRRIGDVVIIRIPRVARDRAARIGEAVGRALRARTVVEDRSGVHGPMRSPDVRVLWGDGTETVHVEAGVRYRLDCATVMFSPGNVAERIGISDRVRPGDVVVDLFAGIGYFSLPVAVRSKPAAVYACELNPVSFRFLVENVRLNRADPVIPRLGDCRETAPRGVADWVLMGHFDAREYLNVAFRCLRRKGTIVYHELCPREHVPEEPIRRISEAARANWMQPVRLEHRIVKSYAPGIVHVVVHAVVEPTMRHP